LGTSTSTQDWISNSTLALSVHKNATRSFGQFAIMTLVFGPMITRSMSGLSIDKNVRASLIVGAGFGTTMSRAFVAFSDCWFTHLSPPRLCQLQRYQVDFEDMDLGVGWPLIQRDLVELDSA